jgi:hypothetical protein
MGDNIAAMIATPDELKAFDLQAMQHLSHVGGHIKAVSQLV